MPAHPRLQRETLKEEPVWLPASRDKVVERKAVLCPRRRTSVTSWSLCYSPKCRFTVDVPRMVVSPHRYTSLNNVRTLEHCVFADVRFPVSKWVRWSIVIIFPQTESEEGRERLRDKRRRIKVSANGAGTSGTPGALCRELKDDGKATWEAV